MRLASARGAVLRISSRSSRWSAVIWPPNQAPLVVAAFYEAPGHFPETRPRDETVLTEAMIIALDPGI